MLSIQERLEQYKEDGYTIFEGMFDLDLIARWKAKYADLVERQTPPGAERPTYWLSSVVEYEPWLMLPAVSHPDILDFAERVMGPFVQLDNLTFMAFPSVEKEKAGTASYWHRDIWAWRPDGDQYVRPNACNAITYLQDMDDGYGPLRVIPGSHRDPVAIEELKDRFNPHPREKLVYTKAGDVIFTHCALLHSGTPNTTGNLRYFFSIYYNMSWLRHRDNHSGPNVQKIIADARAKNDRRMMRLFGVDDLVYTRANSGVSYTG
ncbi:MAG: phytanoyl-CoA dioxygenase family protein [Chloroflexota bacterium]